MSAVLAALPIREQPQYPPESNIGIADLILLATVAAALLVIATAVLTRRLGADRRQVAVEENRARAAMEKLCRHGWSAQLTLYGREAPLAEEDPEAPQGARVRLDWSELAEDGRGVAVSRRLYARSIPGALRAMVEDRRLDAQLEEIERAAVGEDPPTRS